MTFLDSLRASRLLGILRGIEYDELPIVHHVCNNSGLGFIEITMNTPMAAQKITALARLSKGKYQVGAGTVLNRAQFRHAVDAGASFIVSPVLVPEVADAATAEGIPFLPGALTPQDVYNCVRAGATVVKVFPVQCFGPNYLRELRGPFDSVPLLACGGIRPDNVAQYIECGADAVAVGSGTLKREWLRNKNVGELTAALSQLSNLARSSTSKR
jgi:2-dehydro-3-deoxyphosphogluconate aldolase/(4S)-4-hydroxy-2-oxoglutarate aldolase